MAKLSKDVKLRNLEIFVQTDMTRWEEKMEKAKKKRKSIKIDDKLSKKFAKTSSKLQKEKFLI